MAFTIDAALAHLSRLRRDIVGAEARRSIESWTLDGVGTLKSELRSAGANELALAEAEDLFRRASSLPVLA